MPPLGGNKTYGYFRLLSAVTVFVLYSFGKCYGQEVSLLFVGDAMQHQAQIDAASRDGAFDYSSYFQYIKEDIQKADLAVVNLEVTLGGPPYRGYPQFSAPDAFAIALKDAGFDVFLTANNHVLDRNRRGVERTIRVLDSLKVAHTGSFINAESRARTYPLIVVKNHIRMAFLNYTYGTNGIEPTPPNRINYIDRQQIIEDIALARKLQPDLIIANMHWGQEYKLLQNAEQKSLAKFLIEQGADLVIGSHPHVVQPSEVIRNEKGEISNVVVYSMGNFVSNMSATNTDGGQMIRIVLKKEEFRTRILSCQYSLVYMHKETEGKRTDFTLVPVVKAERKDEPLSYPPSIELDETAYRKMMIFTNNARRLFSEHNRDVEEYIPGEDGIWDKLLKKVP